MMLYLIAPLALTVFAMIGCPWLGIVASVVLGYLAVVNELRHRPQGAYTR